MAKKTDYGILDRLYKTIVDRKGGNPEKSHVARLLSRGTSKVAQKVGEEAVETAIAAVEKNRDETVLESADLLFHLMVLWADADIKPADVLAELEKREGVSGFDLKKSQLKKELDSQSN
jgi:phosphoribosyl-ATP pyrophosphohydrolase